MFGVVLPSYAGRPDVSLDAKCSCMCDRHGVANWGGTVRDQTSCLAVPAGRTVPGGAGNLNL